MLEGDVKIRRDQALSHQRNDLIDMRVGINIVEPHPRPKRPKLARQIRHMRADFAAVPFARLMLDVDAVSRRVL